MYPKKGADAQGWRVREEVRLFGAMSSCLSVLQWLLVCPPMAACLSTNGCLSVHQWLCRVCRECPFLPIRVPPVLPVVVPVVDTTLQFELGCFTGHDRAYRHSNLTQSTVPSIPPKATRLHCIRFVDTI